MQEISLISLSQNQIFQNVALSLFPQLLLLCEFPFCGSLGFLGWFKFYHTFCNLLFLVLDSFRNKFNPAQSYSVFQIISKLQQLKYLRKLLQFFLSQELLKGTYWYLSQLALHSPSIYNNRELLASVKFSSSIIQIVSKC